MKMNKVPWPLLVLLASCTSVPIVIVPPELTPTPIPVSTPSPTPTPAGTLGSTVLQEGITFKCLNCNTREKQSISNAQRKINLVINTECFSEHFVNPKFRSELVQTNGLSRKEVVNTIKSAVIHDIPLSMYYKHNGVYGYTYPNDPTIYLNQYFRTQTDYANGDWSDDAEASNLLHEATHKMGFDHDFNRTARRPYSVPYSANAAVDECIGAIK